MFKARSEILKEIMVRRILQKGNSQIHNSGLVFLNQAGKSEAIIAHKRVQDIYNSLSWKITSPLRGIAGAIKCIIATLRQKDNLKKNDDEYWNIINSCSQNHDFWQQIAKNRSEKIEILNQSMSWRITGPLRLVYKYIFSK